MLRRRFVVGVGIGLAALIVVSAAVAGSITATATVTGAGSLSLASGSTATLSDTLDGSDQTVDYTVPLTLTDARGTGAGWNLTLTSTSFNDGAGHTLAAGASSVSSVAETCVSGGTCTSSTNAISYPLAVPAGQTAPAAVKVFDSSANTGMGRFTITPTIAVSIPGNAYAGSYSSTLTVAAVSGP